MLFFSFLLAYIFSSEYQKCITGAAHRKVLLRLSPNKVQIFHDSALLSKYIIAKNLDIYKGIVLAFLDIFWHNIAFLEIL